MNEHVFYTAYKLQSEIVGQEKLKLQELNTALLKARKTCPHEFVEGACIGCGQNEEVYLIRSSNL